MNIYVFIQFTTHLNLYNNTCNYSIKTLSLVVRSYFLRIDLFCLKIKKSSPYLIDMNTILHRLSLELLVEFNINDIHDIFISNRTILFEIYDAEYNCCNDEYIFFHLTTSYFIIFDVHHPLLYHLLLKLVTTIE
ncbi:hypothetical protein EFJ22_06455 [Staphylococcus capitis]|uniref:Uncharacterized protein n=1 Tax=Staphylococcus capitis TaxID=29388 RepID=A0A7X9WAQ0_STACP|nr:hypothetical protein CRN29_09830 [Staphylococcus capitis]TQC51849.1 hypothetical protein EKV43_01685 [Staphylococcus sp. SKL71187]TQC59754.1 hypothetical protein EKV48_05185 [Staphylococcus sp. SKL70935]TQC63893.1 hypothetical protein EKV42_10715 [Staphylococcus sp. SKL71207]MRN09433.1 hypothetical protein [Staphylococcus capitis]